MGLLGLFGFICLGFLIYLFALFPGVFYLVLGVFLGALLCMFFQSAGKFGGINVLWCVGLIFP